MIAVHAFAALTPCLIVISLALAAPEARSADGGYLLKDGSSVSIEAATRRATVTRGGISTPLWDGAHRLDDGSLLIITNGVAVLPREPAVREPGTETDTRIGAPITGLSPCERLVADVCGLQKECAGTEGCDVAGQLLTMEQEERAAGRAPDRMTYTSGQCDRVRSDTTLFVPCAQE